MKTRILLGALVGLWVGAAQASLITWSSGAINVAIPDGNPAGVAFSHTFSGEDPTLIQNVSVTLNISGGYNGDLYGYLVHRVNGVDSGFAVLLNRVGTGPGDSFGYADAGFNNILLDDQSGQPGIHNYGGGGVPTGTWGSDGGQLSSAFDPYSADGVWTLFLADMSLGDQSSLLGFTVNINPVPEPVTWALIIFAGLAGGRKLVSMRKARKQA